MLSTETNPMLKSLTTGINQDGCQIFSRPRVTGHRRRGLGGGREGGKEEGRKEGSREERKKGRMKGAGMLNRHDMAEAPVGPIIPLPKGAGLGARLFPVGCWCRQQMLPRFLLLLGAALSTQPCPIMASMVGLVTGQLLVNCHGAATQCL